MIKMGTLRNVLQVACYCRHLSTKQLLRNARPPTRLLAATLRTTPTSNHMLDARDPKQAEKEKEIMVQKGGVFNKAALIAKNRETYKKAIEKYNKRGDKYKRGHVEFIYAAMARMKEFNVSRDLEMYKMLLDVFPTDKMVVQSMWQTEMMHYPKQQQCAIDLLDQLEDNGVVPDDAMGAQLMAIFGKPSHAFRKYQRIMYWMPKFRQMNPYPIPFELPLDPIELAIIAVRRMAVDLENRIDVFNTSLLQSSRDDTFVVSAQSPKQQQLLAKHPQGQPIYVEGGYSVWLRDKQLTHFILRSEVSATARDYQEKLKAKNEDYEEMFDWKLFEEEESGLLIPPSEHEQEDGTLLAMCITGTGSKDSLMSWVKFLQESNPALVDIPVVFTLRTPEDGVLGIEEGEVEQSVAEMQN